MRRLLLTSLVPLLLLLAPVGATAYGDDTDRGRELAQRLCANCHLNPGQGEKAGASGIPGFKAVANRPTQTREGVEAWLASVPPMMPDHRLTHEEIRVLAAYIMSLRESP